MSENVLIALITVVAASIPQIVIAISGRNSDHRRYATQRLHEIDTQRLHALQEYCSALSALVKYELQDAHLANKRALEFELHRRYQVSREWASVFVSDKTRAAMFAISNPLNMSPDDSRIQLVNSLIYREIKATRKELASILSLSKRNKWPRNKPGK